MNVLSSVAIAIGGRTDGDAGQRARGQSKAPTSRRENLSYINLLTQGLTPLVVDCSGQRGGAGGGGAHQAL